MINVEISDDCFQGRYTRQNPPGQNPPGQNPPLDKIPPGQNSPGQNPPSIFYILLTVIYFINSSK